MYLVYFVLWSKVSFNSKHPTEIWSFTKATFENNIEHVCTLYTHRQKYAALSTTQDNSYVWKVLSTTYCPTKLVAKNPNICFFIFPKYILCDEVLHFGIWFDYHNFQWICLFIWVQIRKLVLGCIAIKWSYSIPNQGRVTLQ